MRRYALVYDHLRADVWMSTLTARAGVMAAGLPPPCMHAAWYHALKRSELAACHAHAAARRLSSTTCIETACMCRACC